MIMHRRPIHTFSVLTHMDLIVDFSLQKWTQQRLVRVLPLSERSVCVLHIPRLFILVVQVMGSRRQIFRLQLTGVSKTKETIQIQLTFTLSHCYFPSFLPVCGFEVRGVVPGDLFDGDVMLPGYRWLSSAGSCLQL